MQTMVFTGRLAADPQISDDFGKAVFRLLEQRGTDNAGKPRLVGVNCVSWSKGLNEKVIARGLAQGCEAVVIGAFIDTAYTARDGSERTAKELVINRLTVLDWAEDRQADASADAADAAFLVAPDGPARRTLAADDPVGNEAIGRFPDAYRCAPAALDRPTIVIGPDSTALVRGPVAQQRQRRRRARRLYADRPRRRSGRPHYPGRA